MKVVISEFMDLPAVEALKERFDTVYDPQLVDDRPGLASLVFSRAKNATHVLTEAEILAEVPRNADSKPRR